MTQLALMIINPETFESTNPISTWNSIEEAFASIPENAQSTTQIMWWASSQGETAVDEAEKRMAYFAKHGATPHVFDFGHAYDLLGCFKYVG